MSYTYTEIKQIANDKGITVAALRNEAMLGVMFADPNSREYRIAWHLLNDGIDDEKAERRAKLCEDGYHFYSRDMNGQPMRCPHCHTLAHVTGGKRQVWTCPRCDALELDYEEGEGGYFLKWSAPARAFRTVVRSDDALPF